ncbi:alpha-1D adrenergic receptor [Pongo pygmaeus]|uniref:Alpha-1D adrenergic receptor n=1 Tax=Pongo abelii TaxID=9601 RepID=H2P1A6_PONAB|nr:alpha-1D adrenergic receptor [Pongo abelii]XP_054323885.1 alpha-1D adrenergic receptor [Pongo pygmaeus]PNJ14065.1 ADRA1D isoform 1 [Pongo abelii]
MTFRDLLSVSFEGPRPDSSAGGSSAGGGGGSAGGAAPSEGPAVGGVPGGAGGGGGGVVGAGSGEDNRSSAGEPGSAGAGGDVNGTAAVGGLVVSAQGVGVGVFLAAFILMAVAGNLLVILSVACNRHLQTVTNYFIVNLAVADLLLSATVLPFSATMEVLGFWAFGRAFCDVWAAVDVLCCTASILSLCTISVDRYVGVRHSLKYPAIMTERKAAAILALLWVVALVVSVGPLLGWKEPVPPDERFCGITEEAGYAVFSSVCSFYLPMAVIVVMYCRVYVVARSTTRSLEAGVKRERGKASEVVLRIHCRGAATGADGAHGMRSAKGHTFRSSLSVRLLKFSREKKAAKTLAIVVGVFVLCWFPFFFVLPLGSLFPQLKPSEGVFKVIFWLGYFNSCVNPLIYPCSSREFKRAFLRLLRCQCRRRRRRRPLWRVYGHHWRASTSGLRQDCAPGSGDAPPGAPLALTALPDTDPEPPGTPEIQAPVASRRKPPSAFREWRLLGPLQRPTTQLRAKVSSLSHKIRAGGAQRAEEACAQRSEVEAVSLGVPHEVAEGATCQAYELADYSNLRETDI